MDVRPLWRKCLNRTILCKVSKLEFNAAGISGAGKTVCSLAEELSTIRRNWDKATTESDGDPFGLAEVEKAFTTMRETWSGELNVYVTILDQLCGKLQTSGKNHGGGERANVTNAHGVDH